MTASFPRIEGSQRLVKDSGGIKVDVQAGCTCQLGSFRPACYWMSFVGTRYIGCISNRDTFCKIHATSELFLMAMRWRREAPTHISLCSNHGKAYRRSFGINPLASRPLEISILSRKLARVWLACQPAIRCNYRWVIKAWRFIKAGYICLESPQKIARDIRSHAFCIQLY